MVEIIEQLSESIRLFAALDIVAGDIIALAYDEDNIYCTLSNSLNPFGMVVGPRDKWGMVPILYDMAILKVDSYDISDTYEVGDLLYSNEFGKLTNQKCHENSLLLGHVVEPPASKSRPMEINWI